MSDKTNKAIENICIGDKILSYDFDLKENVVSEVKSIISNTNYFYSVNNGLLEITDNHPIYTKKSDGTISWASINPDESEP